MEGGLGKFARRLALLTGLTTAQGDIHPAEASKVGIEEHTQTQLVDREKAKRRFPTLIIGSDVEEMKRDEDSFQFRERFDKAKTEATVLAIRYTGREKAVNEHRERIRRSIDTRRSDIVRELSEHIEGMSRKEEAHARTKIEQMIEIWKHIKEGIGRISPGYLSNFKSYPAVQVRGELLDLIHLMDTFLHPDVPRFVRDRAMLQVELEDEQKEEEETNWQRATL